LQGFASVLVGIQAHFSKYRQLISVCHLSGWELEVSYDKVHDARREGMRKSLHDVQALFLESRPVAASYCRNMAFLHISHICAVDDNAVSDRNPMISYIQYSCLFVTPMQRYVGRGGLACEPSSLPNSCFVP